MTPASKNMPGKTIPPYMACWLRFIPHLLLLWGFSLSCFCGWVCAVEPMTPPAELFVSSVSGNDTNAGTAAASPLKTIPAALQKAGPGSTITLLPGVYEGGVRLKAGVEGHPITLRAVRRGRVFFRQPSVVTGLDQVPGYAYTFAAKAERAPFQLLETDTLQALRYISGREDVEEVAGTWCFDEKTKMIYVHPTDSAGVAHHVYLTIPPDTVGIQLADHTVVDGLAMTGFGRAAIRGDNPADAVVQNCIFYGNGYGISFGGGTNCVVRGNEAWGNSSSYAAGCQIMMSGAMSGFLIENNVAHDSPDMGIGFYSGSAKDCMTRGNLIHNNGSGFYYKINNNLGNLAGERNVSVMNICYDYGAPEGGHNTYGSQSLHSSTNTDLRVGATNDWKFADIAYYDYRLQSDSPARGKSPDKSDLGAFQYDGSVVYLSPEGDDTKDGTSVATAWKTLEHAAKTLKPGQTLYIAAGTWGKLTLSNLKSSVDKPTVIRAYQRGKAVFQEVSIKGCAHLKIEGLRIDGGPRRNAKPEERSAWSILLHYLQYKLDVKPGERSAGLLIQASESIVVTHCASHGCGGAGMLAERSRALTLEHCGLGVNRGAGIELTGCADVEIASCLFADNGAGHIKLDKADDFFSEFNGFARPKAGAVFAALGAEIASDVGAWRKLADADRRSLEFEPDAVPNIVRGDFRVKAGDALVFSGRYGRCVGPDGMATGGGVARKPIERVEVLSVTRTSADITWWTPGYVAGTMIEWGTEKGRADGQIDRAEGCQGEYETFHTLSLIGLKPQTTYYFRVGFRDNSLVRWSEYAQFTTAAEDPQPRQLHVAVEGDDAGDGLTPDTAWRTLRKAAREAQAGDTVTIHPGRYFEILRPLHTGTSEGRRITFRAEKLLTVFIDGGYIRDNCGRSHCVQINGKAFITLENLACEKAAQWDNGGYRGGCGYAGLIRISSSAGIEIKSCVMDGRARMMTDLAIRESGEILGMPSNIPVVTVTDSLLLYGWATLQGHGRPSMRQFVFRNNAFVRGMVAMFSLGTAPKCLVFRDNIIQSLITGKKGNPLFSSPTAVDADFNCYCWDANNDLRTMTRIDDKVVTGGLAPWQSKTGQDAHSIEADPGYPLSAIMGFTRGWAESDPKPPLKLEDLILPKDSPCRKRGEGGGDIGPRWEKFLPVK